MTTKTPLDLRGLAALLGVRFYRVRRWRDNYIHGRSNPQSRRLLPPDVSNLDRNPLWSEDAAVAWAKSEGLWPPGVDQFECGYCHETLSTYESGLLRPHGWSLGGDGKLWPCEGSYTRPVNHKGCEAARAGARERSRA